MAAPSYTYSLTNGTPADASQVMQDFNDILNGVTDGTKDLSISALTCAGTATLNGNTIIGNLSNDDLTITASLASSIPIKTTNTYDIGSSTLGLRAAYFGNAGGSTTINIVSAASVASSLTFTLSDVGASSKFVMDTSNFASTFRMAGNQTHLLGLQAFSADATANNLSFYKSRNATLGSHTIVQSGDALGRILFKGSDGSAFQTAAGIDCEVDGTPGASDMPGRIRFLTSPDGSATLAAAGQVDSTTTWTFGATAGAITHIFRGNIRAGRSGSASIGYFTADSGSRHASNLYYDGSDKAITTGGVSWLDVSSTTSATGQVARFVRDITNYNAGNAVSSTSEIWNLDAAGKTTQTGGTKVTSGDTNQTFLDYFEEFDQTVTFTQAGGYSQTSAVTYTRIGKTVIVKMGGFSGTATAGAAIASGTTDIATRFRPATQFSSQVIVVDNANTAAGRIDITTGGQFSITASVGSNSFTNGAQAGLLNGSTRSISFSYRTS